MNIIADEVGCEISELVDVSIDLDPPSSPSPGIFSSIAKKKKIC